MESRKRGLKTYTLEEIKDEMIGPEGSKEREEYNRQVHVFLHVSIALRTVMAEISGLLSSVAPSDFDAKVLRKKIKKVILNTEKEFEDKIFG